jgi:hypothetical protein
VELGLGLTIFIACCMFVIGSLFGSFFSLATYRLPRKEDIIATRSYCPKCKHRLNFFDLIPVFSYIFRGAKCKYCKDKISPRYFLLEVCNGVLFVILYLLIGYNFKLIIVILIYAVFFVIIGANIMKSKMEKEELNKDENKKVKLKNNTKLSKKSGVFISELVIAFVLFIATFLTIIMINKNTRTKVDDILVRANANNILIKNIEVCLAADYDNLTSYSHYEEIDGVRFDVTTNVESITKNDDEKENIVKKIDVKVSYNLNGEYKQLDMETLKGKI